MGAKKGYHLGMKKLTLAQALGAANKIDYGLTDTLLTRKAWEVLPPKKSLFHKLLGIGRAQNPVFEKYFGCVENAWFCQSVEKGAVYCDMNARPTAQDAIAEDWVIIHPARNIEVRA